MIFGYRLAKYLECQVYREDRTYRASWLSLFVIFLSSLTANHKAYFCIFLSHLHWIFPSFHLIFPSFQFIHPWQSLISIHWFPIQVIHSTIWCAHEYVLDVRYYKCNSSVIPRTLFPSNRCTFEVFRVLWLNPNFLRVVFYTKM